MYHVSIHFSISETTLVYLLEVTGKKTFFYILISYHCFRTQHGISPNQRILDASKGPVNKIASVRSLPQVKMNKKASADTRSIESKESKAMKKLEELKTENYKLFTPNSPLRRTRSNLDLPSPTKLEKRRMSLEEISI